MTHFISYSQLLELPVPYTGCIFNCFYYQLFLLFSVNIVVMFYFTVLDYCDVFIASKTII